MATKTISIEVDVYERLRSLREAPGESFSQILRRTLPGPAYWTAKDMLQAIQSGEWRGVGLSEEGLRAVEEVERSDQPPIDPWSEDDRDHKS